MEIYNTHSNNSAAKFQIMQSGQIEKIFHSFSLSKLGLRRGLVDISLLDCSLGNDISGACGETSSRPDGPGPFGEFCFDGGMVIVNWVLVDVTFSQWIISFSHSLVLSQQRRGRGVRE